MTSEKYITVYDYSVLGTWNTAACTFFTIFKARTLRFQQIEYKRKVPCGTASDVCVCNQNSTCTTFTSCRGSWWEQSSRYRCPHLDITVQLQKEITEVTLSCCSVTIWSFSCQVWTSQCYVEVHLVTVSSWKLIKLIKPKHHNDFSIYGNTNKQS